MRRGVLLLVLVLFAGAAQGQSVPILLVAHKAFQNKVGDANLTQLIQDLTGKGFFPRNTPKVTALTCTPATPISITFNDVEVFREAQRLYDLGDLNKDDYEKFRVITRGVLDPNNPKYKVLDPNQTQLNMWSVYSKDPRVLNVVKSMALRKAELLPAGGHLKDSEVVQLPIVYLMLPTHSLLTLKSALNQINQVKEKGASVTRGRTFNRSSLDQSTNFVALATASLTPEPNTKTYKFGVTLRHETGHYLGLRHNFVSDDDLLESDKKIQDVAWQVLDKDCGYSAQFHGGRIEDVDFQRSKPPFQVWDTKPIVFDDEESTAHCLDAYKGLDTLKYPAPRDNLMNWRRDSFSQGRNDDTAALTSSQLAVVLDAVKRLNELPTPKNLCK